MLLTITNATSPATDLGFLLHKHPANVRSVDVSFGRVHVFFPDASEERCTAAVLLDVDPIGLVRRGRGRSPFALAQYVNDRPYVASSLLSVVISKVFGTALAGRSGDRPELVDAPLELSAHVPVLPCRGGGALLGRLFEPLGYGVESTAIPLDPQFPDWGDSVYVDARIEASTSVRALLNHISVLLPVLDDDKHYWVGEDEIDKLLRRGGDWLASHPERELIAERYLRHRSSLAREALARLLDEDQADPDAEAVTASRHEAALERQVSLRDRRIAAVLTALADAGARRVLDLGCGDGRLLAALLRDGRYEEIVGVDASMAALAAASRRLGLDEMSPRQRDRVRLLQGALTYRDRRLAGYDAAVLMEVIEHLDRGRLAALERSIFAEARPGHVIVTTPNVEYNARFERLGPGALRHPDHRFEWTRTEFAAWAGGIAERAGYRVRVLAVGAEDAGVGAPTQMAMFSR
jgi:3' terminal RNA ribose 2'-O-methyltransferase Hen1